MKGMYRKAENLLRPGVALALAALLWFGMAGAAAAATKDTGGQVMDRVQAAEKNRQKWLGQGPSPLADTDPELAAMRDRLVYGEILNEGTLTDRQAALVTLAALTASQGIDALAARAEAALRVGASAADIREALYQCAAYVGFPRVEAALRVVNPVLTKHGATLPLPPEATVDENTRLADGLAVQRQIFGAKGIDAMRENAPAGQKAIVANYLSAYCFGDLYTRKVLDLKLRELITFSAIVALGGCDPQAKAHAGANVSVGNTKQNLVDALAVMLPIIGFPRTLNGLAAVNAALPEEAR
ncbi:MULTISPECIES: carboxymuconolactone decarboxylase family protein [unclassified Desulfovibrio]|uniref:carboxymuconolactone decarboxylase family protein n=1 Tax=unclassified Desulfovibrio TaxID=2593640 RepID=UPI001F15153B|nr:MULTISPECIES: carboxymuconolactone decarboxylase family protein [unclassified Desulfovibrio]